MNNIINLLMMSLSNLNALKKTLLFALVIFIPVTIFNPIMLNMLIGVIVFNLAYQVMAYEDMNGIDYLISYMPVTRKEYVASRYLLGIVMTFIASTVFIFCYYFATKYPPVRDQLVDYKLTLGIGVTTAIGGFSLITPCILKFGSVKGRMLSTFLMIFIVMTPAFILGAIKEKEMFMDIIIKLNNLNMTVVFLLVNIVVLLISYIVSKNIYTKKEIL